MKRCPKCGRSYEDANLNFCLEDGELLSLQATSAAVDDSPPTVMLDPARRTNPTGWPPQQQPGAAPPMQWSAPQPNPAVQFGGLPMTVSPNQTLAIVSLSLGIASMTIGWCCYLGVLLAPASIITGYIALSQINRDPARYAGRGMAHGGIWTGVAYLALLLVIILIYGAAILVGGIN